MDDWDLAWDKRFNPSGVVISQHLTLEDSALIQWQTGVMRKLFSTQRPRLPTLLVIDEGMDFFGPTGNSLHGPIVQKCWRQGGEKGMSCLIGVQRPKSINLQMLTESNLLYLFHLRFANDVKRLQEMGLPSGVTPPVEKHKFIFFKDDQLYPKKIKLNIGA
jgi:hypothetical protein